MTTHHMSRSPEYQAWKNMRKRCNYPANNRYHRYGGRGIKVCDRWLNSFENFFSDMGPCNGLSLDRIDNDGDYTPDNCHWIPMADQSKKTSRIRMLSFDGRTQSLANWAREIGIKPQSLSMRLNTYGWSIEKALTTGRVF
jgi:hypothetical protein